LGVVGLPPFAAIFLGVGVQGSGVGFVFGVLLLLLPQAVVLLLLLLLSLAGV
jgi:hypothetical protein